MRSLSDFPMPLPSSQLAHCNIAYTFTCKMNVYRPNVLLVTRLFTRYFGRASSRNSSPILRRCIWPASTSTSAFLYILGSGITSSTALSIHLEVLEALTPRLLFLVIATIVNLNGLLFSPSSSLHILMLFRTCCMLLLATSLYFPWTRTTKSSAYPGV